MSDDDHWIPPFERDGVLIRVDQYHGHDYSDATIVYTNGTAEVFHADARCHRLHQSDPWNNSRADRTERSIMAQTLEKVMTSWLDPVKPCDYCTVDIETLAELAMDVDDVPEACLKYFEPGDKRHHTTVRRKDGEVTVETDSKEVY